MTVERIKKMERSPKGMVEAMFDSIDALNNKEMTAEEVRAVSHTCKSVVQVVRMEMDFIKDKETYLKDDGIKTLALK